MRRSRILALLSLLLAAGCAPYEGDEAGECDDDADNDRDGLFDCEDPGCSGSSACGPGDDDDSSDDDDDSTTDDDDAGDDDTAGGTAVLIDAPFDLVEISAPNWGYDLATTASSITIEGIARDDVTSVEWTVSAGGVEVDSGTADGTTAWVAEELGLALGDNLVEFTASTTTDIGRASILVTRNDGVDIVSELRLSTEVVVVDSATQVQAAVWLAPGTVPDADSDGLVRVGPVDSSSGAPILSEVWASLTESDIDGLWTGTFVADFDAVEETELRAFVTVGGTVGFTPPVTWSVREALTSEQWSNAEDVAERARAAWNDAGGEGDPESAQDALVDQLMTEPSVTYVATQPSLTYSVSWVVEPDLPFVFSGQPPYTRGMPAPEGAAGRPRLVPVSSGRGALKGATMSSTGRSGRSPVIGSRDGAPQYTDGTDMYLVDASAFGFTNNESTTVQATFDALVCPEVPTTLGTSVGTTVPVGTSHFEAQWDAALQQTVTHGATFLYSPSAGLSRPGNSNPRAIVGVYTEASMTFADASSIAATAWSRGVTFGTAPSTTQLFVVLLPSYVTSARATRPMPDSIVVLSSCYSGFNNSMAQAYLSSGASAFVGYSDVVDSSYAGARTQQFWEQIAARNDSVAAHAVMAQPDIDDEADGLDDPPGEVPTPAKAIHFGLAATLGLPDVVNGDFESGTNGWTFTSSEPGFAGVGSSIFNEPWIASPPTGSAAWGEVQSNPTPINTMARWTQPFCPPPGSTVEGSFLWQVGVNPYLGWATDHDNRLILRMDLIGGGVQTPLAFAADWAAVKPLTAQTGIESTTGWQLATFSIEVPPSTDTQPESITFMTFGWDADEWWALVDDVNWTLAP